MALNISYVNTCGLLNYISFFREIFNKFAAAKAKNFVFEVG